ncbi:MAG: FAD-dependent oxidoreductase [Polyangiaceae bacterium]|nr:FAD-dependent oxidoreductase [Polyangiaceae bacterium]
MGRLSVVSGNREGRVAIVGAGPAGLYAAEALSKAGVSVHIFERLFAPHGLLRYGVAPDHQKIKKVGRVFDKILARKNIHLWANVPVCRNARGAHGVTIPELGEFFDQVLIASGSPNARSLGIPGEDWAGSYSATEFVGWYNSHPDFFQLKPRLVGQRAIIIGMGNVALDVARVLARDPQELAATDISESAQEALARSSLEEILVVARRGPNQAAFDVREVRQLMDLEGVSVGVEPFEAPIFNQKAELMASLPTASELRKKPGKRIIFRFLASPIRLIDSARAEPSHQKAPRVTGVRFVQNQLEEETPGTFRPVPSTEEFEEECSLFFRAIGYLGMPFEGVPFDEEEHLVAHNHGRVVTLDSVSCSALSAEQRATLALVSADRLYAAGWVKRGPTGLIGTNRSCAHETVEQMLRRLRPSQELRGLDELEALLARREALIFREEDWFLLSRLEEKLGGSLGKDRRKFLSAEAASEALRRARSAESPMGHDPSEGGCPSPAKAASS